MAIYSLNVTSIGKTTHASGTAGAHIRYIARPEACSYLDSEHMPRNATDARSWMDAQENADRKNARVLDKVRLALPRELNEEQRARLVRDFCQDITGGHVPWYAAIHQTGDDAHNPHAHIVVRDRDIETGKRVLRWSDSPRDRAKAGLEPNAVEHIRKRWEVKANQALRAAGIDTRIDRRTLEAQGIDRDPTIHIGPQAQHIDSFVSRPESQEQPQRKRRLRNSGFEGCDTTDYPYIDAGRTRKERNAEIIDLNLERAARSPDFETREQAKFLRDQVSKDQALERQLIVEARRRTQDERKIRRKYASELSQARSDWKNERQFVQRRMGDVWKTERANLKRKHDEERETLKKEQSRLKARVMRFFDITGNTRRNQEQEKQAQKERHRGQRRELVVKYRKARKTLSEAVSGRHKPIFDDVKRRKSSELSQLRDEHSEKLKEADQKRQARASEREQAQTRFDQTMKRIKAARKRQQNSQNRGPTLGR